MGKRVGNALEKIARASSCRALGRTLIYAKDGWEQEIDVAYGFKSA